MTQAGSRDWRGGEGGEGEHPSCRLSASKTPLEEGKARDCIPYTPASFLSAACGVLEKAVGSDTMDSSQRKGRVLRSTAKVQISVGKKAFEMRE